VHRRTTDIQGACRLVRSFGATMLAAGLLFALALGGPGASPATAQDWIQFGPTGVPPGGTTNTYDPDFIREWEANPPKGFATLSKANVEATKQAIKRYEAIVASGG